MTDEPIEQNKKSYYERNKEAIKIKRKEYDLINKEKVKLQRQTYKLKNKDVIKLKSKIYYEDNKEKCRLLNKKWIENNKEEQRIKITCECGCILNKNQLKRHQARNFHKNNMNELNLYGRLLTPIERRRSDKTKAKLLLIK